MILSTRKDQRSGAVQRTALLSLIERRAEIAPEAEAIAAPGRKPLSYAGLNNQVREVVSILESMGVGPHDRIAIVQPNGPEMAVAFLGISAVAASAPLNPGYSRDEFQYYISDLKPSAVVVQTDIESPVRDVARSFGIPIWELQPRMASEAGVFGLAGDSLSGSVKSLSGASDAIALVLHTSGTTSRPKKVGLTLSNLLTSASSISDALSLSVSDRCLSIMPLFHVHGLIGALLSSLVAGGSVICTPGFYAPLFFEWVRDYKPTWYTGVPTMHQAILARAGANSQIIDGHQFRLIRSASSPLPDQVMFALEEAFRAPVIEAYGMTEAAHQITSNPLPPSRRKAGTVGIAREVSVAIIDAKGTFLAPGQIGEVVLRGPSVIEGYLDNPANDQVSFADGWFKTGDLGLIDADGYLSIKGRLKEIINRGGEKISPSEVDEVLMRHPVVGQAISFAIPDTILGEDIGAAIVLKNGVTATQDEIHRFLAERLASFKVPRRIVFVNEIPKGATGKPQRIGLAAKLGLNVPGELNNHERPEYVGGRTQLERTLVGIWEGLLGVDHIGIHDTFLSLGGDSMLAARIAAAVRDEFKIEIPVISLFDAPTVASMALLVIQRMAEVIGHANMETMLSELDGSSNEDTHTPLN